jgi:3-oxoacyl-[acyl-carrier protein] reductase
MGELDGSVVIVTGAAQGIGERTARTLAAAGAHLVLADIQEDRVQRVAAELAADGAQAVGVRVDVADPVSALAMARAAHERFGRIDGLVNVAGIDAPVARAAEMDEEHWRRLIDVDLSGQWWCTRAVLPRMLDQGNGRIVFVSSVVARFVDPWTSPAYVAAKAGLIGLTISLSTQLEEQGILVNAVAPGATGSTGTPATDEMAAFYSTFQPLGPGGPQPVADAVTFLLSPRASWISGAVLNVSGGTVRGI